MQEKWLECEDFPWAGNILARGFTEFMQLEQCHFNMLSPTSGQLIVEEGTSQPEYVEFQMYLPPEVACLDLSLLESPLGIADLFVRLIDRLVNGVEGCNVELHMSLSNYLDDLLPDFIGGRPKCREDPLHSIEQAVIGWHENAINESGIIHVTPQNWNQTFRIPIQAVTDNKKDGDLSTTFGLRLVVDGLVWHTERVKVDILDRDPSTSSICKSLNDPHITTFDGR